MKQIKENVTFQLLSSLSIPVAPLKKQKTQKKKHEPFCLH